MLRRLLMSLAIAAPITVGGMAVAPSAEAQWGPPPPPPHWGGPPPPRGWRPPPPPRPYYRPPPPPPRCWVERQRVWVDGPYGPRRVWRDVRICR
jgi:hypothetical protein